MKAVLELTDEETKAIKINRMAFQDEINVTAEINGLEFAQFNGGQEKLYLIRIGAEPYSGQRAIQVTSIQQLGMHLARLTELDRSKLINPEVK